MSKYPVPKTSFISSFGRTIGIVLALSYCHPSSASSYFEVGTMLGNMSNPANYFGIPGMTTSTGFVGTFSWYIPVTSERSIAHLDLGIQNRLYSISGSNPSTSLAFASTNLAARVEFWRLYAGGGYAPINFSSTSGATKLSVASGNQSYFMEGGLIWRVVPEFQITLNYTMETATSKSGEKSTGTAYGLMFRFPLDPKDANSRNTANFDGGRYPFGFMKDD